MDAHLFLEAVLGDVGVRNFGGRWVQVNAVDEGSAGRKLDGKWGHSSKQVHDEFPGLDELGNAFALRGKPGAEVGTAGIHMESKSILANGRRGTPVAGDAFQTSGPVRVHDAVVMEDRSCTLKAQECLTDGCSLLPRLSWNLYKNDVTEGVKGTWSNALKVAWQVVGIVALPGRTWRKVVPDQGQVRTARWTYREDDVVAVVGHLQVAP